MLFALPAMSQSGDEFDPDAALRTIEDFSTDLEAGRLSKAELNEVREIVANISVRSHECAEEANESYEALTEQLNLINEIEDFELTGLMERYQELRRRVDTVLDQKSACDLAAGDADSQLAKIDERIAELSARFLYQRSDNLLQVLSSIPSRVSDWPARLRGTVRLEIIDGVGRGTLLGLLVFVGALAVIIGIVIRKRFALWFNAGNPAGAKPRLKYLFPKPLAYYAPLLLEGLALTGALYYFVSNASLDVPIVRVAFGLFLYGIGCVLIEWATGPLSPSANVAGLIPHHVGPLRWRLKLLVMAQIADFIVSGRRWLSQQPSIDDPLIQVILLGATAFALLFVFFYLSRIPGLQGRFRIVRFAGILATLIGAFALILGLHNVAAYMINGVVQTVACLNRSLGPVVAHPDRFRCRLQSRNAAGHAGRRDDRPQEGQTHDRRRLHAARD